MVHKKDTPHILLSHNGLVSICNYGDPGTTRTCDPLLRRTIPRFFSNSRKPLKLLLLLMNSVTYIIFESIDKYSLAPHKRKVGHTKSTHFLNLKLFGIFKITAVTFNKYIGIWRRKSSLFLSALKTLGGTMKWFKHKVGGRNGNRIKYVQNEFGIYKGYALFFIFMEMCAERYDYDKKPEPHFVFLVSQVVEELKVKHRTVLAMLQLFNRVELVTNLEISANKKLFSFDMPEMLDIIDETTQRKVRKARQNPDDCRIPADHSPAKNKKENKKENKNKNIKKVFDFSLFKSSFKKATGIGISGGAEKRFKEQIKSEKDFQDLLLSVKHYGEFLNHPDNSWRKPKQSMSAYLGTDSTDFFWRDFIEKPEIVAKSDDRWAPLYENQGEKHETL